jgi:hypothetical protein
MIYFLACGTTNSVKIGYTSGTSAEKRVSEIQPGSPTLLQLVAVLPGHQNGEAALHAEFADLRLHHEWFRLEGDLRALVRKVIMDGPDSVAEHMKDLQAKHSTPKNHGTVSAYSGGCRCPACREAAYAYQAAHRAGGPLPVGTWRPGGRGRPPKNRVK